MSFLDEEILSDEFNALSREEKSARSKDLFGEVLKQSPEMAKQFVEADEEGQQGMLNNFRGALVEKYPDQFTTKRTIRVGKQVPDPRPLRDPKMPEFGREGEIPEGFEEIGGGAFFTEQDEDVAVPIVDTITERIASRVDAGDFNPIDALPEDIDLKDISDDDIQKYAELTVFMKQLGNANLISKDKAEAFIEKGEEILQAKGARPAFMSKMTAFAEEQLKLGDFRDLIRTIGEPVARLEGKLEGKSDEEIEALLKEQREGSEPFSELEMAVRGEGIEQAKTAGALGFALASGMAGGAAIQKLPTSALNKLGLTAGLEGAIGISVGDQLPSFAAEMAGVDPESLEGQALNALEGAFIGTIGTLLPKSTRKELAENWREVFGGLKKTNLPEDLASDAKIIAEKFGVSEDEAFKVAEEVFSQKPVSRRDVVEPELAKEVQSPEAAEKLRERLKAEEEAGKKPLISEEEASKDILNTFSAEELNNITTPLERAMLLEKLPPEVGVRTQEAMEQAFATRTDRQIEVEDMLERREQIREVIGDSPLVLPDEAMVGVRESISQAELDDVMTPIDRALNETLTPKQKAVEARLAKGEELEEVIKDAPTLTPKEVKKLADESVLRTREEIEEAYRSQSTPLQVETERRLKRQDELEEVFGGEPAAPRETDVDPDVTLAESNMAQKVETDDGFKLPDEQNDLYNKDIDGPGNINVSKEVPTGKPVAAEDQVKLTGEEPVDPSSFASDAAREANEYILRRLGKGLLGDEPGKRRGLLADNALMTKLGVMGADLLSRGFNKFGAWSKEMVRMYGDSIRGMLADVFESAKS